jgi:DNA (cytosine-5)-methyltransferase 1
MVPRPRNGLSLCAGAGGLDLGLMLAEPGFHTRCFVEWEDHPRQAIIAGQRAGYFAPAPIWDDLTSFDARPFAGHLDTVLAGYPCQPFSAAGQRKGADDPRHLWPHVARVIGECRPLWVFLENVGGHVSLGLDTVLRDLWGMGYTPAAGLFTAAETGAPHERERVFILAHCDQRYDHGRWARGPGRRAEPADGSGIMAHADGGHPGAEREQRGGQLGFQPEGGGTGSDDLVYPARIGRGKGRAQPEFRSGRGSAGIADGDLAHTGGTGPQGRQQPGASDEWHRTAAHGPKAERGGFPLFPPGPGNAAAWADTLATAPDLAPATGLGDCLAWARDLATALEGQDQAQAKSRLRRMAHGLAARSRALRLLGNGVHPLAAGYAWRTLGAAHGLRPVDLEAADPDRADADDTDLSPTRDIRKDRTP